MSEEEKKHSKIRKTISRKIQTDNFESVDVYVSIEEWVEWETEKERAKKTSRITQMLIDDFSDSFNRTVSALNVDRLIGKAITRDGREAKVKEKLTEENIIEEEENQSSEKIEKPKEAEKTLEEDDDWDLLE